MRENCTFRLSGGRRRALQWAPPPTRQRGSRVTPVEGRDLSARQTQYVGKDLEIGKPINSDKCSKAADGVARESVKSCPRAGCGKSACPVRRALRLASSLKSDRKS